MTNEQNEMLNRYHELVERRGELYPATPMTNEEKVASDYECRHIDHELDAQGLDIIRISDGSHKLIRNEDYPAERKRILMEGSK